MQDLITRLPPAPPMVAPALPILWRRHSFGEPIREFRPAGESIADIIRSVPALPARFWSDGVVMVSDQVVPRAMWEHVRPHPKMDGSVDVSLWLAPGIGGTLGTVLTLVASIALLIVAAPLGAALAASAFGVALGLSATVATGLVTLVGALAISGLSAPPSVAALTTGAGESETARGLTPAALQGNVLRPGGPFPHVRGRRKVYPPIVVKPLVELIGDDEFVTGVVALGGPHALTDLRAGGTPLDQIDEIEYQTREGHASDTAITLVTRQSKTDATTLDLSKHAVDVDNPLNLADQTTPLNSVPQWHAMRALGSPDEIWINLLWPQGLFDQDNLTLDMIVPVRLRLRLTSSSTWINVPEIIFRYDKQESFQKDIRLKFATAPALPTPELLRCPYAAVAFVAMSVEVKIGNFTNPERAFNGSIPGATFTTRTSTAGYIGGAFGANDKRSVSTVILWPNSTTGFFDSGTATTITFNLRGKNGSAPTGGNDGTVLGTLGPIADTTTAQVITSTDAVTEWLYLWIEVLPNASTTMSFGEIQFAGENTWSWIAHSNFWSNLTGDHHMEAGNIGTTPVRRVALYADRADVYLPTATFPKGNYDIEIKRGAVQQVNNWSVDDYNNTDAGHQTSGSDLFNWVNVTATFQLERSSAGLYDDIVRQRFTEIWNEHPLPNAPGNLALIAFRAKNRQIGQLSALASRYVLDWNGSAWATLTTSANPAAHLRDVLAGGLNGDPVPADLIDDAGLVEWRQHCIDSGYQINAVLEGSSGAVAAQLSAGCGYARVRQSEKFGVIIDRDRSFEGAAQTFTARNSRGYTWEKAYVRLPSGFRVVYADVANDYNETELIVLDPAGDAGARYEEIRYDGFVSAADVTRRALFDLAQARSRMTFHSFETNSQAIKCKRGDVIALNHPILTQQMGAAYITRINLFGDTITGLSLDGTVPVAGTARLGVAVRLTNGDELITEYVASGSLDGAQSIVFTTPLPGPSIAGLEVGCLVTTGLMGQTRLRLIAGDIAAKEGPGYPCSILAVDEAPDLWGNPTARNIIRGLGLDDGLVLALDAGDGVSFTSGQVWHDTSGQANDFWFGLNAL